ncbi:MAG: UDP-2,4-diacetamido-2,4,6-trideoxy-beta-L-altropyranose hydrolase [Sulfuricella sp.]|nr:UDP-2,4-diacetamido-2,4,6-trideoxy-beta-L-altropyranose hydrolase [Gammaproteobacteria bacterium]
MRVAIRADASVEVGTGHVMRCLALADALRERGAEVVFVCRDVAGNLCDLIEARQFPVCRLPRTDGNNPDWRQDAEQSGASLLKLWPKTDWLIVDHYRLDGRWETLARAFSEKVMAIDDLADRPHDCDLLLDQNYCHGMDSRYSGLVPSQCRLLLGPKYALLRAEFSRARASLKRREGTLQRILVFFGGSDPSSETAKALEGIRQFSRPEVVVDVVVGSSNPQREEIRRLCDTLPNVAYHCQVDNMAEMMAHADLAIGGGGTTTWERLALGLPAIVIAVAPNQEEISHQVGMLGALHYLGRAREVSANDIRQALERKMGDRNELLRMSNSGQDLVDGLGVKRVADALLAIS